MLPTTHLHKVSINLVLYDPITICLLANYQEFLPQSITCPVARAAPYCALLSHSGTLAQANCQIYGSSVSSTLEGGGFMMMILLDDFFDWSEED